MSLVCLFVILLALIVSLSVTTNAVDRIQRSRRVVDNAKALSIAEAGAEYTILRLGQSADYPGTVNNVSFGEGAFSTTVTSLGGDACRVRSTGTLRTGRSRVVEVILSETAGALFPDGAIVTNGGVRLTGNAATNTVPASEHEAHVRANQNVTANGNTSVDGSMIAGGIISCSGNANCRDSDYPHGQNGGQQIPFPSSGRMQSMADDWMNQALAGGSRAGITLNGGATLTITSPVYINGNIKLSSNSRLEIVGNGVVYVTGNVQLSGNAVLNNASTLVAAGTVQQSGNAVYRVTGEPTRNALVSLSADATQAVQLTGNADASLMGLVFAARGGIKISGNGTVYGGLIAASTSDQSVSVNGNAAINYPANLIQNSEVLPRQLRPESWLER